MNRVLQAQQAMNPLHEHLNGVPGPLYGVHRGKCVPPVSKYLQTPLQIGGGRERSRAAITSRLMANTLSSDDTHGGMGRISR